MANIYFARRCLLFISLICFNTYQSSSQATSGSKPSDEGKIKMPLTFPGAVEKWQWYNCSFPDSTTYKAEEPSSSVAGSQESFALRPCADPKINQVGQDLSSQPELNFRKQLCTGFYSVSIQLCIYPRASLSETAVTSSEYYKDYTNLCVFATQLSNYTVLSNLMGFLSENSCRLFCKDALLPVCQRYIAVLCTYAERQQGHKMCMPPPQIASNSVAAKKNGDALTTKAPNNDIKDDNQKGISFEGQGGKALPAGEKAPNQLENNNQGTTLNQAPLSPQSISTDPKLLNKLGSQAVQNGQGNQGIFTGPAMQSEKKPSDTQSTGKENIGAVSSGVGHGMGKPIDSQNTDRVSDNDAQQNGQGIAGQLGDQSSSTAQPEETKNMQNSPDSQNTNGILPGLTKTDGHGVAGQQGDQTSNTVPQEETKNTQNSPDSQSTNDLTMQQNDDGIRDQQGDQSSNTGQQGEAKTMQDSPESQNTNAIQNLNKQQNGHGIRDQQGDQSSNTGQQGETKTMQNSPESQNTNGVVPGLTIQQNGQGIRDQQGDQSSNTGQQGETKTMQNSPDSQNTNGVVPGLTIKQNGQGVASQQGDQSQGEAKTMQKSPDSQNTNQKVNLNMQGNGQDMPNQLGGQPVNNDQDLSDLGSQNGPAGTFPPRITENHLFSQQQTSQKPLDPSKQRLAESWPQNSQNSVRNSQQLHAITYKGNNQEDVPSSGHFFAYFLTAVVICISGYVIFHNKQKIIAFVVEGRNGTGSSRRRGNGGVQYTQLQSNVEEVMPSLEKAAVAKNFVY